MTAPHVPKPNIDWLAYRKCRVCNAASGNACLSRSSRIVGGRPDGALTELEWPHGDRRLRVIPASRR